MAVEVMKLNSGYDMPAVGLPTSQVCVFILSMKSGLYTSAMPTVVATYRPRRSYGRL